MRTLRRVPRQIRRHEVRLEDGRCGVTHDVSSGGLCVVLRGPIAIGTHVAGTVLVEGEHHGFAGVVAWYSREAPGNRFRVGIRFTGLSSLLMSHLQRTFTPTHLPRIFGEDLE